MREVTFERDYIDGFTCTGDKGTKYFFPYNISTKNLWDNVDPNQFSVELLINPYLNKNSNIYVLKSGEDELETCGLLFPASLYSDTYEPERPSLENYLYCAFVTLLERLPEKTLVNQNPDEIDLSECFEDNVCVAVFHKKTVNTPHPLSDCIHCLRKYYYSYFEDNNKISQIEGYDETTIGIRKQKNITINFKKPLLYNSNIIDLLLRQLPYANNATYRFVLLYQVIEHLMEAYSIKEIKTEISKYQSQNLPANDFLYNLKSLSNEKEKIREIIKNCNLDSDIIKSFKGQCICLFDQIDYNPDNKNELASLIYSFRNQMTHNYRQFHNVHKEMVLTIQKLEQVILNIVENYKES